ncbi:MAG: transglycosylase SLT domain-containing protein, partial [Gammaproteobacteria bacterium]
GLLLSFTATAAPSITEQRKQFTDAVNAFNKGDKTKFFRLEKNLKNYILYPYLRYLVLNQNLSKTDPSQHEVEKFIAAYPDSHMAEKLHTRWLNILAQRKDWTGFLAHYNPAIKHTGLDCLHRTALLNKGNRTQAFQAMETLWQTGRPLPTDCNYLVSAWKDTGRLTNELIWHRLRLALTSNEKILQQQLIALLPSTQQSSAKKNLEIRVQALSLATAGDSGAARALNNVPQNVVDQTVREWRIRTAIANSQWKHIRNAVTALPEKERNDPAWRYWHARATEQLGQPQEAHALYRTLAKKTDYYGFLASARLKEPFIYRHVGQRASEQELKQISSRAGLKRAHEFYQLKMIPLARQEWSTAIRDLSPAQLRAAAQLALKWQWHDRSIITAAKAGLMDDITLRFPIAFRAHVITEAEKHAIDPSWIFAIMRRESAFMSDAKSSAGAMGLMQLMPDTAKWLARKTNMVVQHPSEVFHIEKNISLGTRYLKEMLTNNQNNLILATASYNGGPGRIKRWLAGRPNIIADQWIESLPWIETRDYVKNVLAYTSIYDLHFGEEPNFDICLEKIL